MTIAKLDVDGKPAQVVYLDGIGGEVVEESEASVAYVRYEDGGFAIVRLEPREQDTDETR